MPISDITTYLWFDDQALEAAEFYVGLFPNSSIGSGSSPTVARRVVAVGARIASG